MKLLAASLLVLTLCTPAMAQNNAPLEVSGGYTLSHSSELTAHGWNAEVGAHLGGGAYLVVGGGGLYYSETSTIMGTTVEGTSTSYGVAAGPRLFFRGHETVSPFIDAQAGVAHGTAETTVAFPASSVSVSGNTFYLSAGGGADFRISDAYSVRVHPAYVYAADDFFTTHNVNVSVGLVLHLN